MPGTQRWQRQPAQILPPKRLQQSSSPLLRQLLGPPRLQRHPLQQLQSALAAGGDPLLPTSLLALPVVPPSLLLVSSQLGGSLNSKCATVPSQLTFSCAPLLQEFFFCNADQKAVAPKAPTLVLCLS